MMDRIKVQIKNETTLELLQDAHKGDIIDLRDLQKIDLSFILRLIEENKDQIYNQKLKEIQERNEEKARQKDKDHQTQIELIQKEYEKDFLKQLAEKTENFNQQKSQLTLKIQELQQTIASINEKQDLLIQKKIHENEQQLQEQLRKQQIESITQQKKYDLETEKLKVQFQRELNDLKTQFKDQIQEKDNELQKITFQKTIRNVKQTGEDLESWCDHEVLAYMQNGLFECTWEKDNTIVKEEEENKGSKGDFLFKVFASCKHDPEELLTSVLLDMKDENPESVYKKKNEDYYRQLDKNRSKKKCKYAILVSNLELDKPNVLPIYKVLSYQDMYVVRPPYLMTFLNMLVSLTMPFKDLYLQDNQQKMEFKEASDFYRQFEELKSTYLEKPLEMLDKEIHKIADASKAIQKSSKIIDESIDKITNKYITEIQKKLERFSIQKQISRLEKIHQ